MKYAFVNGIKQEASKGINGQCLCCGAEVIAKCGNIRIAHWAHKNNEKCPYSMKEPKTPWHWDWQNHFSKEWQEVRCIDEETGEVHIADIKTPNGLVVEFQHSAIQAEERRARERFHKNMVWVVDGTRLKSVFNNFFGHFSLWEQIHDPTQDLPCSVYKGFIYKRIPKFWSSATKTVYFDFHENTDCSDSEQEEAFRTLIWGFFKIKQEHFVVSISYDDFVKYVKSGNIRDIEQYASSISF